MVSRLPAATRRESGETAQWSRQPNAPDYMPRHLTRNTRNPRIDRTRIAHNKVLNLQVEHASAGLDVPDLGRLVARARDEELAVAREVERVDFLDVALQEVPDPLLGDVPYLRIGASSAVAGSLQHRHPL